jgi:hypothetical protein
VAMDATRRAALGEEPDKPQLTTEAFDRMFA